MRTTARLWRTDKDDEFVLDSDPKAVTLAYGVDDEVKPDDHAAASKALGKVKRADPPPNKQADPPPNKQQEPAPNKGAPVKKAAPRRPAKKAAPKKPAAK